MRRACARPAAGVLASLLVLSACASKERADALPRLSAPSPKQRAAAVQALARAAAKSDDEAWGALALAAHDGSAQVRMAAAGALGAVSRDDALDAAGGLLRDPDDAVRMAAARALGAHCSDRGRAFLKLGFARSDARVRAVLAEALAHCGISLEETLARQEADRRLAAHKLLAMEGAQRARGAAQLGRLGREQDVAALLPLLDDRDGTVVAAAAEALGEAGAQAAAPRLAKLLAEEGEVAGAGAEGLRALGPAAVEAFRASLAKVAARDSDEAEAAARALGPDCEAALQGQRAKAAALLARGCPAAPLVRRLDGLLRSGGDVSAALEALLVARGPAPDAAAPLALLLALPEPDARACRVAEALRVTGAGPALVALVRRERAAIEQERVRQQDHPDDDASGEVSAQAARAQTPAREKYDKLMAKIAQHEGTVETKASAQDQLAALLRGGADVAAGRRTVLIAALQAARALQAPGAEKEARALAGDPDRLIAAAARGDEPIAQAPALPAPEVAVLRSSLWSDDGSERAAACAALVAQHDAASEPTRRALGNDPERRVRVACARANETARPKKG